jgi:dipeptidase E
MNVLLASTSSLFGGKYLEYIKEEIAELFSGIDEIIFIPFARPSGISHDDKTDRRKREQCTKKCQAKR